MGMSRQSPQIRGFQYFVRRVFRDGAYVSYDGFLSTGMDCVLRRVFPFTR